MYFKDGLNWIQIFWIRDWTGLEIAWITDWIKNLKNISDWIKNSFLVPTAG